MSELSRSEVLEHLHSASENTLRFWDKHRLTLLLIITITITTVLTAISITIYNVSGSAQLDLSRPGYESVSDQVGQETSVDEYTATGDIDEQAINDFLELYEEQTAKAKQVDAFNGDPLNPELLQLAPTDSVSE